MIKVGKLFAAGTIALSAALVLTAFPAEAATTSKPKPTATKSTSKSTSKSTAKTTTTKKTTTSKKSSSKVDLSNFGYTPKSLPTNMDIPPVFNFETATSINFGEAFNLAEVVSAKRVLALIQKELAEADLVCETIPDPTIGAYIPLLGSVKSDTLAACKHGDPKGTGFIEYVLTSQEATNLYNTKSNADLFLSFKSPVQSELEQIQFTPSLRAVLFVTGGEFAFDASEISWAVLYNSRFNPPKR